MIQFYAPDIESTLTLPESDSQHCIKVLRMTAGDNITVIDGKGNQYICSIIDPHSKHTGVNIISKCVIPLCWDYNITVAVAPTKHLDRMEWLTEKLTEIGVNRIVPLLCRRSERKEIKVERLQKIAISAMKQSLKAVLPEITPITQYSQFMQEQHTGMKFIAYCDDSLPRRLLAKEYKPGESATILIGPEGDFDEKEISMALNNGWIPTTLGDNRLRTETAALVACDTFHIVNQINS
ncbi:MAG: 16S rRNA (uracil(1498)-N(3))-methyltransferase [Paramuribaculum sp.]|nr:16S rRNA (uracil(1498)-N(3))-methyltransferase [Paramuribaculum sp.]